MKNQEKINNIRKAISLSDQEREFIDERLLKYMYENPLTEKVSMKETIKKEVNNLNAFALWGKRLAYTALTILILFGAGGGTALASKSALPGEALYFFKVNVTEEIKSALLSSVEEKAQWEAERLELRLNEISELVSNTGHISDKLLKNTEKEIKEQTGKVSDAAKQLEVLGETEAIYSLLNRIQDSLETYNSVLENLLNSNTGVVVENIDNIIEEVESTEQSVKKVQFDVINKAVEEKEQKSVDGASIFEFLSINGGKPLMLDNLYSIKWNSKVENEESIVIQLLNKNGVVVGKVAAMSETGIKYARKINRFADLMWNPKYVYDEKMGSSVKVSPGVYKLEMVVQTKDNKTYNISSNSFYIVSSKGSNTQNIIEENEEDSEEELVEEETLGYVDPLIDEENKPDLIIRNVSYTSTKPGEPVIVSYEVVNIGSAVFYSKHTFSMDVRLHGEFFQLVNDGPDSCSYNEHGIDPGEVCTVERSFVPEDPGKYKITLMARGHVEEVDDSNNTKVIYVDVVNKLPDLAVKNLKFDSIPQFQEPFQISYDVENVGSVVYSAKHSFGIRIELDGVQIFKDDIIEDDSCAYNEYGIDAGEVCSVNMLFTPIEEGLYTIYGYVTPKDYKPEKSIENNTSVIEVEVKE